MKVICKSAGRDSVELTEGKVYQCFRLIGAAACIVNDHDEIRFHGGESTFEEVKE